MGKMTLSKIHYIPAMKVCAVLGLIWGFIMGLFALLFGAMMMSLSSLPGVAGMAGAGAAVGVIGFVTSIIFGAIGGAIFGLISVFIYNIVAALVGGYEFDLE